MMIKKKKKLRRRNEKFYQRFAMIAQYQGLNVNELDALRKELREKEFYLKLQKIELQNCIKRLPKKDEKYFVGPTAAAISSDPISTAKILTKFSKSIKLKIILIHGWQSFRWKRGVYNSHTSVFRRGKG